MKNKPKFIYLQMGLEEEDSVGDFNTLARDFITWEDHQIYSDDLQFISVDFIFSRIKELEKDTYIDEDHKRQRIKELKNLLK